jgi:hypothetical protein
MALVRHQTCTWPPWRGGIRAWNFGLDEPVECPTPANSRQAALSLSFFIIKMDTIIILTFPVFHGIKTPITELGKVAHPGNPSYFGNR